jgi:hypothetical protein
MSRYAIRVRSDGHDPLQIQEDPETIRLRRQAAVREALDLFNGEFPEHAISEEDFGGIVVAIAAAPRRVKDSPTSLAVLQAILDAQEREAQLSGFAAEFSGNLFEQAKVRSCGHPETDRLCLSCGRSLCPACSPSGAGAGCPYCHGPVYLHSEEKPPGTRNPAMSRNY